MRCAVWTCAVVVACRATPAPAPQVLAYSITSQGNRIGELEVRTGPDGTRASAVTYRIRGAVETVHASLVLDAAGAPRTFRATGKDHFGEPIDERLDTVGGALVWRSASDHGRAPSGWYVAVNDSGDLVAALARALLRAPDHRLHVLPEGEVWLEDDTTKEIEHQRLRRVAIGGLDFEPKLLWLDEAGELFAATSAWDSLIRTGAEAMIPALVAADQAWMTARDRGLAARLAHHPPAAGLAIIHARLFDSEHATVVPDATVVVADDRITAVGGAATPVPAGAQIIDAHGRTLLPGLWDMHVHLHETEGALHLASGVTTVRDLGNDLEDLTARAARYDAGTELGPNVLRGGLIDGPGEMTAGIGLVAATADEATAAVRRYADAGYVEVKIYNSVAPALVPVIAAAAHARGLRVTGHVPAGMNAAQAIEAGYDELQHMNFVFLRFLAGPGDDTRTQLRVTRVAERGAGLDLDGPEVRQFLDLLVAHKAAVAPTLTVLHNMYTANPGEIDPVYAAYEKRLPAAVARGAHAGGLAATPAQRATYRASFAALLGMVKRMWDRRIPIAASTDYYAGVSLPHELELYVQAGIPPADVLAIATIGAARIMGRDRESGSIAVGKRADLVLVAGDPTRDISAVRNADAVVCRGIFYDPAELFTAVGMRPR